MLMTPIPYAARPKFQAQLRMRQVLHLRQVLFVAPFGTILILALDYRVRHLHHTPLSSPDLALAAALNTTPFRQPLVE